MFREAVVTGRVVDEHGEPVKNFEVELWPRSQSVYGDHALRDRGADTQPDGTFRMGGLPPGQYVALAHVTRDTLREPAAGASSCGPPPVPAIVVDRPGIVLPLMPAAPPQPPRRLPGTLYSRLVRGLTEPKPRADGTPLTYRTTFYPDATSVAAAAVIDLKVGEIRSGIDFTLQPVVATRVTGQIVSTKPLPDGSEVLLSLPDDRRDYGAEARTYAVDPSGAFTLLDVPAGSYILRPIRQWQSCDVVGLDSESKLTSMPIDVPEEGLAGLAVPMTTSVPVTATLDVHGPVNQIGGRFHSLDKWSASDGLYVELLSGGLSILGAVPGSYEFNIFAAPPWVLARVTAGGQDATGRPIVVGESGRSDLVVTMTDRPSGVHGTINTATHQSVDDATVVIFPTDRTLWPHARIGALRFPTVRALKGSYEFWNVLAGDYFIAAVDEATMDAWPAPDFLATLASSATHLHVDGGVAQTVGLTLKR